MKVPNILTRQVRPSFEPLMSETEEILLHLDLFLGSEYDRG